ncbi:MAG: hypothetical protein R3E42_04225 [Burkholderiaceae bacterium]
MALSEETSTIKGALNHRVVNGGTLAGKDAGALSMKPAYPIPNSEVLLYPFTAQLEEILRLEEANASRRKWGIATQKTTSIGDPRLYQYVKLAQTDKYGRFQFTKVRPGRYLLMSRAWDVTSHGSKQVVEPQPVALYRPYTAKPVCGWVDEKRLRDFTAKTTIWLQEWVDVPGDNQVVEVDARARPRP